MCFTHSVRSTGAHHWTLKINCPPPIRDTSYQQMLGSMQASDEGRGTYALYITSKDGECNGAHTHHYELKRCIMWKWNSECSTVGKLSCSLSRNIKTNQTVNKRMIYCLCPFQIGMWLILMSMYSVRIYATTKCQSFYSFSLHASPLTGLYDG